jgi:hypothetical protein
MGAINPRPTGSDRSAGAAAELDARLEARRTPELGRYRYVILDCTYKKVRQGGLDAAILIACGVGADGKRDVPGCSVCLSEAEVPWRLVSLAVGSSAVIVQAFETRSFIHRFTLLPGHLGAFQMPECANDVITSFANRLATAGLTETLRWVACSPL